MAYFEKAHWQERRLERWPTPPPIGGASATAPWLTSPPSKVPSLLAPTPSLRKGSAALISTGGTGTLGAAGWSNSRPLISQPASVASRPATALLVSPLGRPPRSGTSPQSGCLSLTPTVRRVGQGESLPRVAAACSEIHLRLQRGS
jgi:hypothetical protein